MSVEAQKMTCEFFAEMFDEKWIANVTDLFTNGEVAVSSGGFFAHYALMGSNLEGMLGKTLTYLMVCIMCVCVVKLKEMQVMKRGEKVDLLAFLDDGLGGWVLDLKNYQATVVKIMEVVREVYSSLSMELKPSKCYPSDRFFVFLNTMYYGGARLFDHTKTFLKAGISRSNEIMSAPERIREIGAWASGAAASGGDWVAVYCRYLWQVWDFVFKADPRYPLRSSDAVIHVFSPVPFGGLGACHQNALVSNIGRQPVSEAIAFLRMIGHVNPLLRNTISRVFARPMRRKDGASFLRAPGTVLVVGKHLVESTLSRRIEEKVAATTPSVYLEPILTLDRAECLDSIGRHMMATRRPLAKMFIESIYEAMPEKIIEDLLAKFKKSDTVAAMFGKQFVRDINEKYKKDIRDTNKTFAVWLT